MPLIANQMQILAENTVREINTSTFCQHSKSNISLQRPLMVMNVYVALTRFRRLQVRMRLREKELAKAV